MAKGYLTEPLLKEWDIDTENGSIHVELRDASKRVEEDRTMFANSLAGHMKAFVPFVANDEDNFPDYPHGATRHWLYSKKGNTISVLEVQDMDWKFELYPFDECVTLTNDPFDSGIERYNTYKETELAVIKLFEQIT